MANPGAAQGPFAGGAPAGRAPDISSLSHRERFDRLFNRVMAAAERGDSATVVTFMPMALGAYSQLDSVDVDARYHAALLLLQVDNVQPALALADTIETLQPGHLFGYLVRGAAADRAQNDTMRRQAYRDFLAHYEAERRAGRLEYREHQAAIDEFRKQAESAVNGKR
jgi:predicted AlkP superfamily pyrophosphatase or phosphodiesterase